MSAVTFAVFYCESTYHDKRVRNARDNIKLGLKHEREVAEDSTQEVDRHEQHRNADDLAVLVDLVVLWTTAIALSEH